MNLQILEERVIEYISLHHEGEVWDFKRQWYDKEKGKTDLLHDIICMANTIEDEDGLIIIGVDEENDYSIKDVSADVNRRDTHELVEFLRDKHFDGGVRPMAHVESLFIEGKIIDVIIVENSTYVPFYLNERFQKLEAYNIYTRVGDSNTPVDKSADRDRTEKLWRKRFGIDKTALQRFQIYLKDINGWESVDGQQTFFYKSFPEFRIETEVDEERDGFEYYCYCQLVNTIGWFFVRLKYHATVIDETLGISLDGGRFFTAVPNDSFTKGRDFFYSYVKGTLQHDLMNFLLHKTNDTDYDSISRWKECIPIFKSEYEKKSFSHLFRCFRNRSCDKI